MPNFSLFARLFVVVLVVATIFAMYPAHTSAQSWSGIIDSSRAIDWSQAGVPGGIPTTRTQCGSTIAPTTDVNVINTALSACGANQFVKLGSGTFNLNGSIIVSNNNVTLRGSGPDQTILVFSSFGGCNGWMAAVCAGPGNNYEWLSTPGTVNDGVSWTTPWTGGYAKGTTQLTVGSTAKMAPGRIIYLDQLDETADDGGLTNSSGVPIFSNEGVPYGRHEPSEGGLYRTQHQIVKVVSVNDATHVTITPGVYMPNWRSSQSPAVSGWGNTDSSTRFGIGIEDLTVRNNGVQNTGVQGNIQFGDCYGCWAKNIRSMNSPRRHVGFLQAAHIEVRDSYFYGTATSNSQSYGLETFGASDILAINNVVHHVTAPFEGPCQGCVEAYNYTIDDYYTDGGNCGASGSPSITPCNTAAHWPGHDSGGGMRLLEGNQNPGATLDYPHGNSPLTTFFRNAFRGNDDFASRSFFRVPLVIKAFARATNVIGNVLGDNNLSMVYESASQDLAIYQLGEAGALSCCTGGVDNVVKSSLMRWGNYDTATDTARFVASEVPTTGIPRINGNPVPSSQTLPNSFFLSARPSFWATPWGTPNWPPIGPDVTGGTGVAGHVYDIPAKLCFNHLSDDPAFSTTSPRVKLFNAGTCYTGGSTTVSVAPPVVTINIQ